ncbi:YheV family putative metal-binding protein [Moraxella oblonga]|uniref:YheV family putative metal-binding protein n=1 Tax=Moraxella oblonga TaxID=200413 RepID=UPI00082EF192|nr:YheV family putative metal-binding protein [Moraxella oblonga]
MRYQSNRPKRQFLAGVKCTHCGQIDTTVQVQIFTPEPDEYIECVKCQHIARRPTKDDLPQIQANTEGSMTAVGVVRFVK